VWGVSDLRIVLLSSARDSASSAHAFALFWRPAPPARPLPPAAATANPTTPPPLITPARPPPFPPPRRAETGTVPAHNTTTHLVALASLQTCPSHRACHRSTIRKAALKGKHLADLPGIAVDNARSTLVELQNMEAQAKKAITGKVLVDFSMQEVGDLVPSPGGRGSRRKNASLACQRTVIPKRDFSGCRVPFRILGKFPSWAFCLEAKFGFSQLFKRRRRSTLSGLSLHFDQCRFAVLRSAFALQVKRLRRPTLSVFSCTSTDGASH